MKKQSLKQLIRKDILYFKGYQAVPSALDLSLNQKIPIDQIVKLDAGENLYGLPQNVLDRLSLFKGYQFYPDSKYIQLRKLIGKYANFDQKYIFVSSGGDELIDLILRLTLEVGDVVINCPPTFGFYNFSTLLNRGIVKNVLRNSDYTLNVKKIINSIDKKVKVIFICNPNNPTGQLSSLNEIRSILKTGKLVVVDETYFEFSSFTTSSLIKKYRNLIIVRSFSKWAGLAGLRLGYGIMSPYLVNKLVAIKMPYNVNSAVVVAGLSVFKNINFFEQNIQIIISEREKLYQQLTNFKFLKIFRSSGNFIFVQSDKNRMNKLKRKFQLNNIAVRFYDSPLTGNAVRITIGLPNQNKKILKIFQSIYAKKI